MTKYSLLAAILCICAVDFSHGWFGIPSCRYFLSTAERQRCYPCTWFRTKEVTLVVRNMLEEPTIEESVVLDCTRSKYLFDMMTEAANTNSIFRFTATYFNAELGFYIEAINKVFANTTSQTWWEVLDGNGQRTPVGVSSYQPSDGETVTFNFTQGYGH